MGQRWDRKSGVGGSSTPSVRQQGQQGQQISMDEQGKKARVQERTNVHYQRVVGISESWLFYYPMNSIFNYTTTTLATNYNYIGNS
jgi:hypothetical protein